MKSKTVAGRCEEQRIEKLAAAVIEAGKENELFMLVRLRQVFEAEVCGHTGRAERKQAPQSGAEGRKTWLEENLQSSRR